MEKTNIYRVCWIKKKNSSKASESSIRLWKKDFKGKSEKSSQGTLLRPQSSSKVWGVSTKVLKKTITEALEKTSLWTTPDSKLSKAS